MATKKEEKKEKVEEQKVLTVKVEPAPKEAPGPTVVEQRIATPAPAQSMSAADQEALRVANQRSVNHEPVEKTFEAVTPEEAEQRAADQDELNAFLASEEADLDPTTKKLTKKQVDAQRKAAADKKAADEKEAREKAAAEARIPRPPTHENNIPRP